MATLDGEERHEEVTYAEDSPPSGRVLRVLMWAVIFAVALCVAAYLLLRVREAQLRPGGRFPEKNLPAPHTVADVRQVMFELGGPRPLVKEQQRAELDRYGWVDEQHHTARIPVERAMELMLRQDAAPGGER